MLVKKLATLSAVCLLLLQVSCGKKPEDTVEMKDVRWGEGDVLKPGQSLSLIGDIQGEKTFSVSFLLKDANGTPVQESAQRLRVMSSKSPNSRSLNLKGDMRARVEAGPNVCNGRYILVVNARVAKTVSSKALEFEVQGGLSEEECKKRDFLDGKILNRHSTGESAFDLVGGEALKICDNAHFCDLKDVTPTAKMDFSQQLGSGTAAQFVEYIGNDLATLTIDHARVAYRSGMKMRMSKILRGGESYLVYLPRNQSLYALRVTKVVPGPKTQAGAGSIEFEYRKLGTTEILFNKESWFFNQDDV